MAGDGANKLGTMENKPTLIITYIVYFVGMMWVNISTNIATTVRTIRAYRGYCGGFTILSLAD